MIKLVVLLISVVILQFCESREWKIDLEQDYEELNKNYFDQESYEDVEFLVIHPGSGYIDKNITVNRVLQTKTTNFAFLSKFPNLEKFFYSYFNYISFEDITSAEKLKTLRLTHNNIKILSKTQFKHLVNLEDLTMSSNRIEFLFETLLRQNKKLKKIDFSFNDIQSVPKKFFKGLLDLEEVYFNSNRIKFLPSLLFEDNKKLTRIYFYQNRIQKHDPQFLNGLDLNVTAFDSNPCIHDKGYKSNNLTICFENWEATRKMIESEQLICGKPLQAQRKIFGGTPISRGKYPWMAAFYYQGNFQCGSSLISQKHILLAAHCIDDRVKTPKAPADCKFLLGRFNLSAEEDESIDVGVTEFILHPDWTDNPLEWRGDVAVAILDAIIEFSYFIRPICLNEQKLYNFHDEFAIAVGWGATEHNPRAGNDVALEVNVKVHETRDCLDLDPELKMFITRTSFCAGNRDNTGSCVGDSGGPLIVEDGSVNQFKAVGIISASVKNAKEECDNYKNQIYTEVAAYHDWITDHVFATY